MNSHAARYWRREGQGVRCELCPHTCLIAAGALGRCGVRRNRDGELVAETYALASSLALDPMEKKPLYHFYPGRSILSVGSAGCNFRCSFCQNWSISQNRPELSPLSPEQLVEAAVQQQVSAVAYTYNEPLVNFEYLVDSATLARERGLLNVVVSNGFIRPEPLAELAPWIDAWNIDLKSIREEFYREFCGARLEPVQETIRYLVPRSHVELTYLIVTRGNDQPEEMRAWVEWVAALSPEIPVHISRYFPQYRWDAPPTAMDTLQTAFQLARASLAWVYLGNTSGEDDSTRCPQCGEILIERSGYRVGQIRIQANRCPQCGRHVPGRY